MAIMEGKAVQLHSSVAFVQLKDTCDRNVVLPCVCMQLRITGCSTDLSLVPESMAINDCTKLVVMTVAKNVSIYTGHCFYCKFASS